MATLSELQERFSVLRTVLKAEEKRAELASLKEKAQASTLWDDQEGAVKLLSELSSIEQLVGTLDELEAFLELSEGLSEADMAQLERDIVKLEQQALLSAEHDKASALLTIHAGTGGVDAQDFAEMLQRMYLRYIESGKTEQVEDRALSVDRSSWQADIIELTRGEEAGIKRAVIEVRGAYAYGLLKSEAGVHRLVRLSPFNAKNLRQTSFALIEVIPEVEQASGVTIDEKELRIDVFRAGGHGGQGVNTTDSAVRLTHIPTGLVVSVQNERSQHQNKATAMKILQSKLVRLQELKNAEETAILKGEFKEGSWGNQIRSYVLQPYQLVKDYRSDFETSDVSAVLDGKIQGLIEAYLKTQSTTQT